MKKYITPEVLCYEFETVNIIASSIEVYTISGESGETNADEWNSRESNNNSNMWESGW